MSVEVLRVDEDKVKETFGTLCIDLASASLGGEILSFSDEFFADASNLINPAAPIRRAGYFVPTGAWYDGWETRRHNPEPADWVIIKLGVASGIIHGFEVDTAFFNGNHAPAISVDASLDPAGPWTPILATQPCGPSQRHFWKLPAPTEEAYTHVRLNMHPDGGIARFRVFGTAVPVFPEDPEAVLDLAFVGNGGHAVSCSDQHFGTKDNLLLPGRGKDMGDGWETSRSRVEGHVDWVVVKLGAPGVVSQIVVDTLHFRGNFPQAVEVYAVEDEGHEVSASDERWELAVARSPCQKDTEHTFTVADGLTNVEGRVVTHVKLVMIPDGGIKRLRVFGTRAV